MMLSCSGTELSPCDQDIWPAELKDFLPGPLQKEFTDKTFKPNWSPREGQVQTLDTLTLVPPGLQVSPFKKNGEVCSNPRRAVLGECSSFVGIRLGRTLGIGGEGLLQSPAP